jgi:hypothetical protein
MTETPSKAGLLAQIEREQAFWTQLLAEIGTEHMLQPGAAGDWSFKDVVAHLNGWRTRQTVIDRSKWCWTSTAAHFSACAKP